MHYLSLQTPGITGNIIMEVEQNIEAFLGVEKIKQEYGESVEPKVEWDSELEIKKCESNDEEYYRVSTELYEDHIIKEELVLGPEVIQRAYTNCIEFIPQSAPPTTLRKPTKYSCDLCLKEFSSFKSRNQHKEQFCPLVPRLYIPTLNDSGNRVLDTNMECLDKDIKSGDPVKKVNLKKATGTVCSICNKYYKYRHSQKDCINQKKRATKKDSKQKRNKSCQDKGLMKHKSLDNKKQCNKKQENLEKKEIIILVVAYSCEFCKLQFKKKKRLQDHVENVCVVNPNNITKLFSCDMCQKSFKVKKRLISHIRLYHCTMNSNNKYQCYYCKKEYSSQTYCQNHIKVKHMNSKKLNAKCDLCLKEFSNKKYRDFHVLHYCRMSKNNIPQPVVCILCKKEFANQMYLGHHIENTCPTNHNKFTRTNDATKTLKPTGDH